MASAFEYEKNFLLNYVDVVEDGYYCKKNYSWNAVYLPLANKIEICKNNVIQRHGNSMVTIKLKNALHHEAVHLAQDCKAGLENKKMLVLYPNLISTIPAKISSMYSERYHRTETEAERFAKTKDGLKLVETFCKRV